MALAEETPFSEDAAEEQIEDALVEMNQGTRRFPGMSFEEGVVAALNWALGNTDEIPYPES